MRLLVDTNVVLDLMLAREPFAASSAAIVAAVEAGHCEGYLCATTITTIHYLAVKALGRKKAEAHVSELLGIFRIAAVNEAILSSALRRGGKDFEDDVLIEAALSRENSKRARFRAGHRRRGRRRYNVVWRCSGGVPTVASFSPLVRRDAHQKVSQLSPARASLAVPERAECFAWLRLSVGADAIVTRNAADFRQARLAIYQPRDAIALLEIRGGQ